jgi:glyoxylate reductase
MRDEEGATSRARILVPQPIRPEGLAMLREVGDVEVLAPHPEEWMDVAAATARGIPVTKISGDPVNRTTAELTVALLLGLAWRIVEADHWTKCGKFRQEQSTTFMCHSVGGKTLGLVGLGRVGTLVAQSAPAFGLRILYTKRVRLESSEERRLGVEWAPLDDLLQASDFVSIHASYNPSSHGLIGTRELGLMKKSAFLINTARGRILDEEALIQTLTDSRIAGAGLDVYIGEPPVTSTPAPNPKFFKLDNVILFPHAGGQTEESLSEIAILGATNLVAMVRGERPPDILNPEV